MNNLWCILHKQITVQPNDNYLVEGVLEKQGKKLYNWKLRTRLNPPQVDTDKQAQKICELFLVTAGRKRQHYQT